MIEVVGKFEKVSYEEFEDKVKQFADKTFDNAFFNEIGAFYSSLKEPKRATSGSAGYDFCLPYDIKLHPGEGITIPTGFKVKLTEGWMLGIYPRSGLGFKYRVRLANTIGVIDTDYYNNEGNEGHIMIAFDNGYKTFELKAGDRFAQGIFQLYGITENDEVVNKVRSGGMGSTGVR